MRSARARTSQPWSSPWWLATALGGLLVGVVALSSEPGRDGADSPASRLLVELPHVVVMIASIAGSVAILLWFAFLLALARRQRKDAEPERALRATLIFSLIVLLVALFHRDLPPGLLFRSLGQQPPPPEWARPPGIEPSTITMPLFTGVVGALILLAAVASLAFIAVLLLGDRLSGWRKGEPVGERPPLAIAVDESLDDLRSEADARLAIIRCYRRFEEALAMSRVPRAPWQTPFEFMRDALARLPLPSAAVEQLTRLFERARFSNEALARVDHDTAWASLHEIRRCLAATERDGR